MILCGSVGMGEALHVSRTIKVILLVTIISELQACCHCSFVRWLFFNRCMSSSIWLELFSKNLVWKFSSFSCGMGLSILGGGSEFVVGDVAISVFMEICSCMGKWSEFS